MSKKDEIIEAAGYFFSDKGYDLSMSDIADKVGIKTPSLYSHFGSKEELIWLTVEKEIFAFYNYLNQTIDISKNENAELQLRRIFLSVFKYFDKPERLKVWRRLPLVDNNSIKKKCLDRIRENDERITQKVKKILDDGVRQGEVSENIDNGVLLLFLAMIQGLLDKMLLMELTASEMEKYTLVTWETFWKGIK